MSLNIKNERVHALAQEAARRTGKTQTSVIEEALERLLAELDRTGAEEARRRRVDFLLADMHARVTDEDRAVMSTDILYDEETGLPA